MKRCSLPVVLLGQALALRLHAVHVLPGGLGLLLGLLQLGLHVGNIATCIDPVRLGILQETGQETGGRRQGSGEETGDRRTEGNRGQGAAGDRRQEDGDNRGQGAAGDRTPS